MEENYSKEIKNIIEFMWKNYEITIIMGNKIENNKNILGTFTNFPIKSRVKLKIINIDLAHIKLFISEKNIESGKFFVLLHEIGHFLLDKSRYIQKEEYADFLACLLAKKILTKNEFLSFFKKHSTNLISSQIFQIESDFKRELIEMAELFFYNYIKFLKSKGEL